MASTPAPRIDTEPQPPTAARARRSRLTPEYRKAHKNYVLVAALLASWELIGINLNTKEKWGIELTSPRGVPLILFTLLVYCAYKTVVEWIESEDGRPKSRTAKIDFWIAHFIGVSAVLIGLVQYLWRIRVADLVANRSIAMSFDVMMTCSSGILTAMVIRTWNRLSSTTNRRKMLATSFLAAVVTVLVAMFLLHSEGVRNYWLVIFYFIGGILLTMSIYGVWLVIRRYLQFIPIFKTTRSTENAE